jgi:hypothetical protein
MALLTGKDGSVKIGGTAVASVTSWKLNIGAEVHDCSILGTDWVVRQTGAKDATGTVSVYMDGTDTGAQQAALRTAAIGGTAVALELFTDATYHYAGSAFVTLSASVQQGSVSTMDFNFSANGTWTYGNS